MSGIGLAHPDIMGIANIVAATYAKSWRRFAELFQIHARTVLT